MLKLWFNARRLTSRNREGKTKYIGISECNGATLRRAHAVHPIAAVQIEYSAFELIIESKEIGLLAAARELGVAIIPFSPLGKGLVSGKFVGIIAFNASAAELIVCLRCRKVQMTLSSLIIGGSSQGQ